MITIESCVQSPMAKVVRLFVCSLLILFGAFFVLKPEIFGLVQKQSLEGFRFENVYGRTKATIDNDYRGSLTIDLYVRLEEFPNRWTTVIGKFSSDTTNEFHLRIRDSNVSQWYYGNGTDAIVLTFSTQDVFVLNEWVRITAIRDLANGILQICVNGKIVASRKIPYKRAKGSESSILLMGCGNSVLRGEVFGVRIWKGAMSKHDIWRDSLMELRGSKRSFLINYFDFSLVSENRVNDSVRAGIVMDLVDR